MATAGGEIAAAGCTGFGWEEEGEEEHSGLEPFFFDEAAVRAEHAAAQAAKEKLREKEARERKQLSLKKKAHRLSSIRYATTTRSRGAYTTPASASRTSADSTSTRSDETLTLTGPKRALVLLDYAYVEIDLKIKGHGEQKDKEFSKGFVTIDGIARRLLLGPVVETRSLATRLSTMEIVYGVVNQAVEATIAIQLCMEIFVVTSLPGLRVFWIVWCFTIAFGLVRRVVKELCNFCGAW
ncbi:hypothetical protein HU200_040342 [Digitaria exilis]|uniref:DUF6598 domain-containing protein n=1 Tax=Digitaria exilis TaxID=1010633 RepID=A0A835EGD6_9POAL|nr:hypothetical protein HU200_040342 [Digitaria exilis]